MIVQDDAIDVACDLAAHISFGDVMRDTFGVALDRIAEAAAAARTQREPIARLQPLRPHLAVRQIYDVLAVEPQQHLVALALHAAGQPPWRAMNALDLQVERHRRSRLHHLFRTKPAAMPAGAAGIIAKDVALDEHGIFRLGLLDGAVMSVAVIEADGRGHAVFIELAAPAAA